MSPLPDPTLRALALAPLGRDAQLSATLLRSAGIEATVTPDLPGLVKRLSNEIALVVVTEEAVRDADLSALHAWIVAQESWSDLPFLLITFKGGGPERNPAAARLSATLGNVTFLERPFHPTTFVSLVQSAVRARRRQHEVRGRIEAVHQAEQSLRVALTAGRLGSWTLDLSTHVLETSETCKANFGRRPDQAFSYEDLHDSIHPEDRTRVLDAIASSVESGEDYDVAYRNVWPDRTVHWAEIRARVVPDAAGCAARMIGVSLDVTQRKAEEALLAASETKFRTFAQSMPHQVWSATPEGKLDWFSERVYAYIGQGFDELAGDRWAQAVHEDDLPAAAARWAESVSRRELYETEFRIRRFDGAFRWHLVRAVPIHDEAGQVVNWIGTNTDIDDQKVVRDQLARLNETLEERVQERTRERDRMWRLSGDLMSVHDRGRRLLAVNAAWSTLLGWSEKDLVDRPILDLVHPEDFVATADELIILDEGSVTRSFENRLRERDGDYRTVAWTAASDRGQVYAIGRDVTAQREVEAQLRQAQKMEAIGQLTGGIAHDFNNMLTGIIGSLDILKRRIEAGRTEDIGRLMDAANTSAQRAAALTHRLLAFSRRQSLDSRRVDVNELVGSMEELLRRTLGEGVRLEIDLEADLWPALSDPSQLESALLNLAINSRDAMPDGGRLTIETANTSLSEGFANRHEGLSPGDYIAIAVTDTGVGMDADTASKAFDPFFTTKPIGQGTGLGLSMIYGFAKQSNGLVRLASLPGKGTIIKLFLPRFRGQSETARDLAAPAAAPRGDGETVFLVEDDSSVRFLVAEVLKELGYRFIEAVDGDSALPILESGAPIDLMISDVGLPGLNGRQLAEIARRHRPGLRVLFITGYAENAVMRSEFLDPGMEMILKPFDVGALAHKIREMIAAPPVLERRAEKRV